MRLHGFALSVLVGVSAASFASFDMFIAPNAAGTGYTRFDPINRVALGTISLNGGRQVSAVAARPNGLYQYGTGWALINNSTGERVSNPTFSPTTLQYNKAGSLIALSSGSLLQFVTLSPTNLLTLNSSWSVPGGFSIQGVTPFTSDRWLVYGTTASGLVAHLVSDAGTTLASSGMLIPAPSLSATGFGQAVAFINGFGGYGAIPYRDNTGAHRLANLTLSSTSIGLSATQAVSGFSTASAFTTLSAVEGHNGFFLVGADSTTSTLTRITEFDSVPNFAIMQDYTTSAWSAPTGTSWRMANVVAPEPASMTALGIGALALLKRRRKR